MQIALAGALAKRKRTGLASPDRKVDPIFTWAADWRTVWSTRKDLGVLVLVNQATGFTAAVYPVKLRGGLGKLVPFVRRAIEATLQSLQVNPDVIDEYLRMAGNVRFVKNKECVPEPWVKDSARMAAYLVPYRREMRDAYGEDTLGVQISRVPVKSKKMGAEDTEGFVPEEFIPEEFIPEEKMLGALAALTGKPLYRTRAFELEVTLDLGVYKATRRLIVPAQMDLFELHLLLQKVYGWKKNHLFRFDFFASDQSVEAAGVGGVGGASGVGGVGGPMESDEFEGSDGSSEFEGAEAFEWSEEFAWSEEFEEFAWYERESEWMNAGTDPDEIDQWYVPYFRSMDWNDVGLIMYEAVLSTFLPQYARFVYTYDFGDLWEHEIRLVRVIDDYDQELPYLVEAIGQAPPEDVGGVDGFLAFLEGYMDREHEKYEEYRLWAFNWTPELRPEQKEPGVRRIAW